jgi:hypothetical protein
MKVPLPSVSAPDNALKELTRIRYISDNTCSDTPNYRDFIKISRLLTGRAVKIARIN